MTGTDFSHTALDNVTLFVFFSIIFLRFKLQGNILVIFLLSSTLDFYAASFKMSNNNDTIKNVRDKRIVRVTSQTKVKYHFK